MRVVTIMFVFTVFTACKPSSSSGEKPGMTSDDKKQIIENLMSEQEDAWNKGNLEAYMKPYNHSDSLLFIGSSGLNYGWETTLANYQKSYPDKATMGTLQFENLEFKDLGTQYSFMIGRWYLYRSKDTGQGSYSLLWQWNGKTPTIIADHSS